MRNIFGKSIQLPILLAVLQANADEFQALATSFSLTKTLAGVHHATNNNPDGSAINFWNSGFEGQPAVSASLSNPHAAGADAYGNIFIADKSSHAILRISADGLIHTFAGTHVAGFNGDGPAQATSLQISSPNGLHVLPNGVVYLLDPGNHRIRRVNPDGQMTTVIQDTDPNWAPSGRALWVSPDEQVIYYTHEYPPVPPSTRANGAVLKKWTPAGGIQTVCSRTVGLVNPANIDVNPADGKLYLTDRAEEDSTKMAQGLFRIDGIDQRTRITGNASQPNAAAGHLAINSFIEEPRGIAFRPDGAYFICGHKDGSIWFVDTTGILHQYLNGSGKKDAYAFPDNQHPPLVDKNYFSQPRSVGLAPNGNLLMVSNDSGFLFQVQNDFLAQATNLNLRLVAAGAQLEWLGAAGRGYRIERATNLQTSAWNPVNAVRGVVGTTTFFEPSFTSNGNRFYRVLPAR